MKICIVSVFAYPLFDVSCSIKHGGAEVQVVTLAHGLARLGNDVTVIVFDVGQPREQMFDGVRVTASIPYDTTTRRHKSILAQRHLWGALERLSPDVTLLPTATGMLLTVATQALLHRSRSIGLVMHDSDLTSKPTVRGLDRIGWELGLRLCDQIITLNDAQTASAQRIRPRRWTRAAKLHPATNVPAAMPKDPKMFVLWLGRCVSWKRPEIFVELARAIPQETFVMISPPSNRVLAERVAAAAAGLENLTILEHVPNAMVNAYFARARIFVNTSEVEGFPTVFLEASAAGCPIVSLKVDPDGYVAASGGFNAQGDVRALTEETQRLLGNPAALAECGRRGFEHVKRHHDALLIARRCDALLREVMAR